MKRLLELVFNRHVFAVLGLVALALLIWFVGPLVRVAEYAPLEREWARALLIGLVVAAVLLKWIAQLARAAWANRRLVDGLLRPAPPAPAAAAPEPGAEEVALLGRRFEESMQLLRRGQQPRGRRALALPGSRRYVYELPWYLIIGAPGSGKTTALRNADLRFPLAERTGADVVRGVGGTRNCDWWFTDEAVLLDTAGRYTTQDSDASADRAAWTGFLALLRKYRPRRPINGVLVAVSVADLLEQGPQRRADHAQRLRARLQELHEGIGIRFPIYVLVTKVDLLPGFVEFFGDAGKEERAQVWGVSFAYDARDAAATPLPALPDELAQLAARLEARLIERLQGERDPARRAALYLFPQHWSRLRDTLTDFLQQVFAPSRFEERPLLRGVYFTSGTQEGAPIDRLVGDTGRALGLAVRPGSAQRASGRSYFLARLLKEVIFAEAGLAGANLKWERRRALAQWGAIAAAVVASAAVVLAWSVSYARNRAYVAQVGERVQTISRQLAALEPGSADVAALLPVLQSVRQLADASPEPGARPPLAMGFGLYQGDKLGAASREAYGKLLHEAMLPRLVRRIARQLASGGDGNPELLYEALKAYVMLHDPRRFDAQAVRRFVAADWDTALPRELPLEQRKALETHLDALLAAGEVVSPLPADAALLARARAAVAQTPLAVRAYNRLKRLDVGAEVPEFTIARAAGPGAPLVLERASGQPLTSGVPGLYSYAGYHRSFVAAADRVAAELAAEADWVLGAPRAGAVAGPVPRPGADPGAGLVAGLGAGAGPGASGGAGTAARERLTEEIRRLYLEDYARLWEALVRDIRMIRPADLTRATDIARTLAAPADSPLPRLYRAIAREVTLGKPPEAEKSATERGADALRDKTEELRKLFGRAGGTAAPAAAPSLAEQIVDARFAALRRMVTPPAEGQPAPIDAVAGLANELYTWLVAARTALDSRMAPPPAEAVVNKVRAEAVRVGEPVGSMLTGLSSTATTLVFGSSLEILNGLLRSAVHEPCVAAVQGRYPIVRGAAQDATLEDFARVFGPGGVMDDFFAKHLQASVDTSTTPWTFRKVAGSAIGGDPATLEQFRRADTIRKVFFRGATVPTVRLQFQPLEMDAGITQFILDVDGQLVRYAHGPQVMTAVQWPGPVGRQQVHVEVQPPPATGAAGLSAQGPWALFRLFDRVQMQPGAQPERFLASFDVEGRKAQFEVRATSVQNPFRLRELAEFQCPLRF